MEENQMPEEITPTQEAPKSHKGARKKNRNKKLIIIISTVVVLLALAGGGVLAYQLTRPSENKTNNSSSTESTTEETTIKDGENTANVSNTIPKNFPSDISLYPGQTVINGVTIEGDGYTSWGITAETTDDLDKTYSGVKSLFGGWQVVSESKAEGRVDYTKGDYNVTTYVTYANGVSTINYSVSKLVPIVQEVVTE